jgi:hypothetical protein
MVQVYDGFLEDDEMNDVLHIMTSDQFPWYINLTSNPDLFEKDGDEHTYEAFQLTHVFVRNDVENSGFARIAYRLLERFSQKSGIDISKLLRVKANLQYKRTDESGQYNTPHVDSMVRESKVLIYYVDDSDGDTFIFDRVLGDGQKHYRVTERVAPKKGRFVLFDNERYHAGTNPRVADKRIVINFNFL